jgi:exopolysaccharide/PEP-CTERM locus tyrosine autokinase
LSKIAKALEKAKKDRLQRTESPAGSPGRQAQAQAEECEVQPKYSRTRVIDVDENQFEANFIFMGLDDCEIRDRFNLLRTQLLQRTKDKGWNTIMVTSAVPGEGKTITAINLAMCMARESQQTALLLDANFRNPKVEEYMGLGKNPGLTDHLLDDIPVPDMLINPGVDKMVVLPSGGQNQGATDLLGSPKLKALVKDLKSRYPDRYVIYDCPHVLNMPDTLVFSSYVDAVLLVVDASKTSRDDIKTAVKTLEGANLIGVVMNKSR